MWGPWLGKPNGFKTAPAGRWGPRRPLWAPRPHPSKGSALRTSWQPCAHCPPPPGPLLGWKPGI